VALECSTSYEDRHAQFWLRLRRAVSLWAIFERAVGAPFRLRRVLQGLRDADLTNGGWHAFKLLAPNVPVRKPVPQLLLVERPTHPEALGQVAPEALEGFKRGGFLHAFGGHLQA